MINQLTEEAFVQVLQQYLSPTAPIQSGEHLYGRDAQIREVQQALHAAGRTIFIHGDRGVGKTSLAQTVAFTHQSVKDDPILLACTPETTFAAIIRDTVRALNSGRGHSGRTTVRKFNMWPVGYEVTETNPPTGPQALPLDLNEAVAALQAASGSARGQTVVVIDEFDRITSDREKTQFADFIKQIGDRRLGVRFVFCGVAAALDSLLGKHESCYRYITAIELPRLSWDARWAIIEAAATALGVTVGEHPKFRIAAISDGFPHYVHLVCEKLFWQMFNDPHVCNSPSVKHYTEAVASAVLGIEQHLKRAYEKATLKDSSDYEEVLWAVADHSELIRHVDSIYDSYQVIAKRLDIGDPLDRAEFGVCLRSLRSASSGHILASTRRGWYQFRENIVRGYVRLRAEEQGLELALDYQGGGADSSGWTQRGVRAKSRRAARGYRSKG